MTAVLIAPSLLAADFARLADALRLAEEGGADLVHVDVMDGHFVPNLTIGPPVVRSLRRATRLPLDVHLMIERPEATLPEYLDAGADWISVHVESTSHLQRCLDAIRRGGARAGVALNPGTPAEALAVRLAGPRLRRRHVGQSRVGRAALPRFLSRQGPPAQRPGPGGGRQAVDRGGRGGGGEERRWRWSRPGRKFSWPGLRYTVQADPASAISRLRAAATEGVRA